MIVNYDNATIEIKFRQPMEVVKIENVMNISTENGYMVITTRNNKKYIYSEMYVMSIEQLDEVNWKEMMKVELTRREMLRAKLNEIIKKMNGNQLYELEKYVNEVKVECSNH
jgi:hypothetical protein